MLEFSARMALHKLVTRVVKLVMIFFLALPGLLLNLPVIIFTRYVSRAKQVCVCARGRVGGCARALGARRLRRRCCRVFLYARVGARVYAGHARVCLRRRACVCLLLCGLVAALRVLSARVLSRAAPAAVCYD